MTAQTLLLTPWMVPHQVIPWQTAVTLSFLGKVTVWENLVASCQGCNTRKRGRTPEQAGMKLLKKPEKPRWLPAAPIVRLGARRIPEVWTFYCAAS